MNLAGSFHLPDDHPALAGHFPGHPLVPGVVLLEMALALIMPRLPGMTLAGIAKVKFTAAVQPDQEIEVQYDPSAHASVDFICRRDGIIAVQGTALLKGLS